MGFILLIVFILTIFRVWKQSSLRTRQHGEKTHANKSIPCPWCFLCIYMHIYTYLHDIYQRLDNTRVGAKSASWRSWVCEQFALPHGGQLKTWAILQCGRIWGKNARNSIGRFANRPYNARKKPHANINDQWSMINDLCSLLIVHHIPSCGHSLATLFTLHFSLPSPLLLLFSFLTTILLDLYFKNVVFLHRI